MGFGFFFLLLIWVDKRGKVPAKVRGRGRPPGRGGGQIDGGEGCGGRRSRDGVLECWGGQMWGAVMGGWPDVG